MIACAVIWWKKIADFLRAEITRQKGLEGETPPSVVYHVTYFLIDCFLDTISMHLYVPYIPPSHLTRH